MSPRTLVDSLGHEAPCCSTRFPDDEDVDVARGNSVDQRVELVHRRIMHDKRAGAFRTGPNPPVVVRIFGPRLRHPRRWTLGRRNLVDGVNDEKRGAEAEGLSWKDGNPTSPLEALIAHARTIDASKVLDLDAFTQVELCVPSGDRRIIDAQIAPF